MRAVLPFARLAMLAPAVLAGLSIAASASKIDRGAWQGLQYQRAEVCWTIYAVHPDLEQAGDRETMERIIGSDPAFARTVGALRNTANDLDQTKIVSGVLGDIYPAIRDLVTNQQVDLDRAMAGCEDLKRDFRARLGPLGLGTP
jgi:hypothetical protein